MSKDTQKLAVDLHYIACRLATVTGLSMESRKRIPETIRQGISEIKCLSADLTESVEALRELKAESQFVEYMATMSQSMNETGEAWQAWIAATTKADAVLAKHDNKEADDA